MLAINGSIERMLSRSLGIVRSYVVAWFMASENDTSLEQQVRQVAALRDVDGLEFVPATYR